MWWSRYRAGAAISTRPTIPPAGSGWTGRCSPRPSTRPTTASSRTPWARTAIRWTRWSWCKNPPSPGDPRLEHLRELDDVPEFYRLEIHHFFTVYKELEPGRTSTTPPGPIAPPRRRSRGLPAAAARAGARARLGVSRWPWRVGLGGRACGCAVRGWREGRAQAGIVVLPAERAGLPASAPRLTRASRITRASPAGAPGSAGTATMSHRAVLTASMSHRCGPAARGAGAAVRGVGAGIGEGSSGVAARTARPPPAVRGRASRAGGAHLLRYRLVKRLGYKRLGLSAHCR